MTIIYVHGVKVRSEEHGKGLHESFDHWLAPKLSIDGEPVEYDPVYWGDVAAKFAWNLSSRPRTKLLHMGGADLQDKVGSLIGATESGLPSVSVDTLNFGSSVLDAPVVVASDTVDLSTVPVDRRGDFLADFYLASRPFPPSSAPVEYLLPARLAIAATEVAGQWDALASNSGDTANFAAVLLHAVDEKLDHSALVGMGGFKDWIANGVEVLKRAVAVPGDAVGTVLGEGRPLANEFIAYFIGDVFTYLVNRGNHTTPGEIPKRVLNSLKAAHSRKKQTGEKIILATHSMGGQLIYDAITYFADHDPELVDLEIDHWFTFGCQVSLFAEMHLFLNQPLIGEPDKLPRPKRVNAWTNFYDVNDLVGFIMEPVFKGVKDSEYNTGYGLALAHTGFLARPTFYQSMAKLL